MRSLFRPGSLPDPGILDNHRPLIRSLSRRGLLRGTLSLGTLTALTGCNVSNDASVQSALRAISAWNDKVQAWLFNPNKLAPTYPASLVLKPPEFNAYYDIEHVRPVDGRSWKLEVRGRVADRSPWTIERLAALPQYDEIIRHICVEGWSYIGEWSGPRLGDFLDRIGADTRARYVYFTTADDYPSSIDMPTARHPQTLLALTYARQTLPDPYGYPLRLRTSTKLGFKNPKWLTSIEVTNEYKGGYWESRGFNWFSGL